MYVVIASVARQSHAMESITWRLPRNFVPRNDELIRGSLGYWPTSIGPKTVIYEFGRQYFRTRESTERGLHVSVSHLSSVTPLASIGGSETDS